MCEQMGGRSEDSTLTKFVPIVRLCSRFSSSSASDVSPRRIQALAIFGGGQENNTNPDRAGPPNMLACWEFVVFGGVSPRRPLARLIYSAIWDVQLL